MKGLSLTQPWASLVALGAKHFETRSYPGARSWRNPLPRGVIVAVVDLIACLSTDSRDSGGRWFETHLSEQELAFGDFSPGRWAWELANVRPLPEPIPCRGYQQLWDVPPDVLSQIEQQLGADGVKP